MTRPGDALGCGRFDILPIERGEDGGPRGMYGRSPHVASWGGTAIYWPEDELYHLFVSEMNEGCGLGGWMQQCHAAHAVAPNATGPFTKLATVLPAETHNVQPMVDHGGAWWIFHIGLCPRPLGAVNGLSALVSVP
jgi:hypothetical protein